MDTLKRMTPELLYACGAPMDNAIRFCQRYALQICWTEEHVLNECLTLKCSGTIFGWHPGLFFHALFLCDSSSISNDVS